MRQPRHNARGQVWCSRCKRYLDAYEFRPHPTRPRALWSYCKPCTREIDRERYARKMSNYEAAVKEGERRLHQKRKQTRKEDRERRFFVAESIGILRRRGLTKSEIARLANVSLASVLVWERKERRITPHVASRFVVVVRETSYLATGHDPAWRRRLPHPDMPLLVDRIAPQLAAYPVRSRWHTEPLGDVA